MKIVKIIFIIVIFFCFFNGNTIKKAEKPIFKLITEALYYAKETGFLDREEVLKNEVSKIYKYDELGRLINIEEFYAKKKFSSTVFVLNEKGNIIKSVSSNGKGKIDSYSINKYNDNDSIIEVNTYDKKNKLLNTTLNKYDSKNYKIEEIYNDFDYNRKSYKTYKYNSKNQ